MNEINPNSHAVANSGAAAHPNAKGPILGQKYEISIGSPSDRRLVQEIHFPQGLILDSEGTASFYYQPRNHGILPQPSWKKPSVLYPVLVDSSVVEEIQKLAELQLQLNAQKQIVLDAMRPHLR